MMNPLASSNNHKHAVAMPTKIANNTGKYGTKDQKMDRIQKLIQENNSVIALINIIKSQEGNDCKDDLNTLLL